MRKLPLIIALISLSLISAYALVVNLLPNTVEFPRIPTGPGTIGGTITQILGISDLANYTGDGTVPNTMMLSGISSTGYLRGMHCGAGQVWKTIDGGIPTCGDKNSLLARIGTTSSVSGIATVYHADGTSEVISSATGILEGDIIRTDPGSSLMIVFSDLSLLRIDADSTVSLDTGTLPDGTSIAYAILENGGLWGRVLTETGGYYIGRDDLIVGVRGTSVYFTQNNPTVSILGGGTGVPWHITKGVHGGAGTLAIIDSDSAGVVATLDCIDHAGISRRINIGTGMIIPFGAANAICHHADAVPKISRDRVFSHPALMAKITENTVKDLQYLGQYVFSGATGLTAGKQAKILREYNATLPRSAIDLDAICPDDLAGSIAGVQNIFWPTLIGTGIEIPPCQDQHVLAVADFRAIANHPDRKNLFLRTGNPLSPIRTDTYGPSGSGIEISAAGQYLEFNTGALGFSFSGVIVKLELNSIIPDEPDVKYYLIDLGGTFQLYMQNGGFKCQWKPGGVCGGDILTENDGKTLTIKFSAIANATQGSRMIIGAFNNAPGSYILPIQTIIKKISISQ